MVGSPRRGVGGQERSLWAAAPLAPRCGAVGRRAGERGPGPLRRLPLRGRGRSRSVLAQRDVEREHHSGTRHRDRGNPRVTCPSRGLCSASSPGPGARRQGRAENEGVCYVCLPVSSRGCVLPSGEVALWPGPWQESWSPAGRDAQGSGARLLACLVSAPSASMADNSFTTCLLKGEIYKEEKERGICF